MTTNAELTRLVIRKKCLSLAQSALQHVHFLTEPVEGVQTSEVGYYAFTLIDGLSPALKLSAKATDIVLPSLWNYLDAACFIAAGLEDLCNEEHHRKWQLRIQGALNIFAGVQLLVFSLNPALMAALGLAGMPALLGNPAFVIGCGIDVITAGIEFHYAVKESGIEGWMEERLDEYAFVMERMHTLQQENVLLELDADYAEILTENTEKLAALEQRLADLHRALRIRCKVHASTLTDEALRARLADCIGTPLELLETEPLLPEERAFEEETVNALNDAFKEAREELIVRSLTFVGMTLMAAASLSLVVTCPPAIPILGFAITALVAAFYLYRHHNAIIATEESSFSFFSSKKENVRASAYDIQFSNSPENNAFYHPQ